MSRVTGTPRVFRKPSLRFIKETGLLEYRCPDCANRGNACWWILDEEFWNFGRSFARCRACWLIYDRKRIAAIRQDAEYRERERLYAKDYYDGLTVAERRAVRSKGREYHRDWMRAYRAKQKAAA